MNRRVCRDGAVHPFSDLEIMSREEETIMEPERIGRLFVIIICLITIGLLAYLLVAGPGGFNPLSPSPTPSHSMTR